MKVKVNSNNLNNIISENIKKAIAGLDKNTLNLLKEEFESMGGMDYFEAKDSEKSEKKSKSDKNDGREADINYETKAEQEVRSEVEDFFKKKGEEKQQTGVNNAYFAYKLAGIEPQEGNDTNAMKNARSKFEKKLNHDKNDAGYPASFSSQEINQLQSLISSDSLSESISMAIKKVLKEDAEFSNDREMWAQPAPRKPKTTSQIEYDNHIDGVRQKEAKKRQYYKQLLKKYKNNTLSPKEMQILQSIKQQRYNGIKNKADNNMALSSGEMNQLRNGLNQ